MPLLFAPWPADRTAGGTVEDLGAFLRLAVPAPAAARQLGAGGRDQKIAINQLVRNSITGPRSARILSLLNVAIYDATIAAWDSKYVHNRPRPSEVNSQVAPTIPVPNSPSYPSEHAAVAAAAALGYAEGDRASEERRLAVNGGGAHRAARRFRGGGFYHHHDPDHNLVR